MRRVKRNYAYPKYRLEVTYPDFPVKEAAFMQALLEELPKKTGAVDSIQIAKHKGLATATLKMHTIHPKRIRDVITKALGMLVGLGEIEDWYLDEVDIEAY